MKAMAIGARAAEIYNTHIVYLNMAQSGASD